MNLSIRGQVVVMEPVESRWERLVREVRGQLAGRGLVESDIEAAIAEARGRPRA